MITPDDVRAAARLLDGVAARTPLVTSRTLGEHVVLKPECLQRTGSFKFRGAYNKVSSLARGAPVVAFSSGNHAQAVALAARLLGNPATILMPIDAPASKLAATQGYGAEVVTYDRYSEDREAIGAELAADRAAELVRPFDDPMIMAGAGTAALELLEEHRSLDTLVVPPRGRWADLRLCDDREVARRAACGRCRAGGGRRLGAVVRRRPPRRDRRAADDRRRPPGSRSRRARRGRSRRASSTRS